MTADFKYKAFISYSHLDQAWGDWLHKALERYRVPKRMVGKQGRNGTVPPRLFPIFRDREELPTSSDLGQQINEALTDSAYLIVICSPHAAQSRWVNEEVLTFKRMGRDNRILGLIVDGEPHATGKHDSTDAQECFPPALRFSLNAQGVLESPIEPLAADARPGQDTKDDAKLKLIAGLLGIGFDELKRRDLQATSRRRRLWLAAAGLAGLIVAGGLWQIDRSNQEARWQQIEAQADRSRKFAEASRAELDAGRADHALLFALQGIPLRPPGPGTPEADAALTAAYAAGLRFQETLLDAGHPAAAAFSSDGARIATLETTSAQIWDTATGRPLGPQMPLDGNGRSTVFSPDDARLLTFTNRAAEIWDTATGRRLGQPMRPNGGLEHVQFTANGQHIVTVSGQGVVQTWDATTGNELILPVQLGRGEPSFRFFSSSIVLSSDATRAVASTRDTAQLYDATTGAPLGAPMSHDRMPQIMAFSPDGEHLLTVSWNKSPVIVGREQHFDERTTQGVLRVWDARTGAPLGPPMQHEGPVLAAAFSPDGRYVVTGSEDGTVRLWNPYQGKQDYLIRLNNPVKAVGFSPDGDRLLTVAGPIVQLWDTLTAAPVGPPRTNPRDVVNATFSPDGRRILIGSQVWNASVGAALTPPMDAVMARGFAVMSRNGKLVATISQNIVQRWDATDGSQIGEQLKFEENVKSAVFSQDGSRLLLASVDGTVRQWDTGKATLEGALITFPAAVNSAIYSADEGFILAASDDGTTRLIDAKTMADVFVLRHAKPVRTAVFSPDGARIVTASDDGTARLWDARTGAPLGAPMKHDDAVTSAVFSADGKRIVTASMDRTVRFWDAATGAPQGPALETDFPAKAAMLNHDGTRLLTITGYDYRGGTPQVRSLTPWFETTDGDNAQIWEVIDGNTVGESLTRSTGVNSASFSPDGMRVAMAFMDRSVRLWDAATGAVLGSPLKFDTSALSVAFGADNERIVTMTWDTARVWDVGPPPPPLSERAVTDYLTSVALLSDEDRRRFRITASTVAATGKEATCDVPEILRHPPRPRRYSRPGKDVEPATVRNAWRKACEAKIAAQPNQPYFRYQLGRVLLELHHDDEAVAAFEQAANAGYSRAFLALGDYYANRHDADHAIAAYENAFRHDIPEGGARLADLAWAGEIVPLDRGKALRLWNSAADRGDIYANERLATLYESGSAPDVPVDLEAALYRWSVAGEVDRQRGIDDIYVRARRASLARYFGRSSQSKLISNVWNKVVATLSAVD